MKNHFSAKKSLRGSVALLSAVLIGGMSTSCIDSAFDLDKDFDWTINTGYLSFPIGKTDTIYMDDIIELDADDDLQVVVDAGGRGGEYHLIKNGDIEESRTHVERVNVEGSTTHIDPIIAANEESVPGPGGVVTTDVNRTGEVKADATDIDEALKELGSLQAAAPTTLTLRVRLEGDLNFRSIDGDLTIKFPDFLVFSDPQVNADNEYFLQCRDLQLGSEVVRTLHITGYRFGAQAGEGLVVENREIHLNEDVLITGQTEVTLPDGGVIEAGQELRIVPTVELANMSIAEAKGVIQPDVDASVTTVDISNLPDFLNDDSTHLALTNPVIEFRAHNPLQAPVNLNGFLQGNDEQGNVIKGSQVRIGQGSADGQPITLQPGDNLIALSRLGEGGSAGAQNIRVSDLNNLLYTIPDQVQVEIEPEVTYGEYYTVALGQDYRVSGSYDIDVPLSFEEGLNIVYTDSADDFNSDIEDLDIAEAEVAFDAVNCIPLDLEIKNENVTPLDINKQPIPEIKVEVTGSIKASADGVAHTQQQMQVRLIETAEGAVSRLDGLRFRVTAVPGQAVGVTLRSDQWLRLENIRLRVPKGINVDLN